MTDLANGGTQARPAVLVVTSRFPYPPIGGDKLRIWNIITSLSRSFDVDLLALYSNDDELAGLAEVERVCRRVVVHRLSRARQARGLARAAARGLPLQVGLYLDDQALATARELITTQHYAVVLAHLVRTLEYALSVPGQPVVLELTDAISMNYHRIKRPRSAQELVYVSERRRLQRYERTSLERVGAGVVVARQDADYLVRLGLPPHVVRVISNGTDVRLMSSPAVDDRLVAFMGNMRSTQNEDMVRYFVESVWPRLRTLDPTARFEIIGANASKWVRSLAELPGISVTGSVPDVAERLSRAAVSVCPMRYGAGVQNKILESMALGVPVVTTSLGLEGIDAAPGEEILVADDRLAFAEAIVAVMHDPGLRQRVSAAGQRFVEQRFRWDAPMGQYADLIREIGRVDGDPGEAP